MADMDLPRRMRPMQKEWHTFLNEMVPSSEPRDPRPETSLGAGVAHNDNKRPHLPPLSASDVSPRYSKDMPHYANLRDGDLMYPEAQRLGFWLGLAGVLIAFGVLGLWVMAMTDAAASAAFFEIHTMNGS